MHKMAEKTDMQIYSTRLGVLIFGLLSLPSVFAEVPGEDENCSRRMSYENVGVADPVYRDLDKLIASDLLDYHSYSDRPWSLREILRIIIEVGEKYDHHTTALKKATPEGDAMMMPAEISRAGNALRRLRLRYANELKSIDDCVKENELRRTQIAAEFEIMRRNSGQRPNPGDVGITAQTNGKVDSFTPYQNGRALPAGNSFLINAEGGMGYGPYLHLQGSPLVSQAWQFSGESKAKAYFEKLYLKAAWRNLEVQIGRDEVAWGQKEFGGLLYSNNALPPDMIKVTSSSPFSLGALGHGKATFFFSQLGEKQIYPHHKMLAYKFSLITSSRFEMGVYQLYTYGGIGSPDMSAEKQFFHFLYLPSNIKFTNDRNVGILDIRYRPRSRTGGQYYFEMESSSLRLHNFSAWSQTMGFTLGAYYPLLGESGSSDLRFEGTYIPVGNFRHSQWKSGSARNELFHGEAIGPDATQLLIKEVSDLSSKTKLASSISWHRRGSDIYKAKVEDGRAGDDVSTVSIVQNRPTEYSWRLVENLTYSYSTKMTLGLTLGLEYFRNYLFINQRRYLAYATAFEVKYSF